MSAEGIVLAARRLLEFESIQSKLHEARRDAITDFDTCIRAYRQKYSGQHELRRDLNECEWATYRYASLLHMLDQMVRRTSDEFGIRLRDRDPVRHEVPKLIGVRHCIHHRGLVGVNIAKPPTTPGLTICMHVESLRRHGNWGGNNPDFRTFFYDEDELLVLRPIIETSERKCDAIVTGVIDRMEEQFGEDELLMAATNVDL